MFKNIKYFKYYSHKIEFKMGSSIIQILLRHLHYSCLWKSIDNSSSTPENLQVQHLHFFCTSVTCKREDTKRNQISHSLEVQVTLNIKYIKKLFKQKIKLSDCRLIICKNLKIEKKSLAWNMAETTALLTWPQIIRILKITC